MTDKKLSVVIITKDEEANIRGCLESVKWADEIIIVDEGSNDATVDIAKEFTDNIFTRHLEGFGAQKQFGVDKSSGEWILILDADEVLSEGLQRDIKAIIFGHSAFDAYKIWRKTFYLGKWVRYCGWYNSNIRMFKRGRARMDMRPVHESVVTDGPVGEIRSEILHYSYKTIDQHIKKMCFYTDYEASILLKSGARVDGVSGLFKCAVKPLIVFFRKYIILNGYRDGMRGLIISVLSAIGLFLNYMKLWQMRDMK